VACLERAEEGEGRETMQGSSGKALVGGLRNQVPQKL